MRLALPIALTLLFAACNPNEGRFISRLAEQDCTYALECFSDSLLNHYGWTDQETCESLHGPILAAYGVSCEEYDPKAARACIKDLRGRSCTTEGPDLARPASCDTVFASCSDGALPDEQDTDTSDDTDA